ncbi:MAG: FGGY family carbohydrate kinase [Thermonemataceae bacterium]
MKQPVTAIFDIGKTNKKFFLFDEEYNEVHREFIRFEQIPDDDGYPSENLQELSAWMKEVFQSASDSPKFDIRRFNVSAYGASLVHLDEKSELATPFYNYLKPYPKHIEERFWKHYGDKASFEIRTSSPYLGMLNAGLQLYFIKYEKPELFSKIHRSLHFPQYLSALFTGQFFSDYTSVGCHTGLWNQTQQSYADWVRQEELDLLLSAFPDSETVPLDIQGIKYGIGIHDSSAALIPYLNLHSNNFVLISTGTWSICLNPFNHEPLSTFELDRDCLHFLTTSQHPVKASRLFLGKHLSNVARLMSDYFQVDYQSYKKLPFPQGFVSKHKDRKQLLFDHAILQPERFGFENQPCPNYDIFNGYEDAIYHLFDELSNLQIASLQLAIGNTDIKNVYVDGGFSASKVFMGFLANKLPNHQVYASSFPLGSAVGAAMVVDQEHISQEKLEKLYQIKLTEPVL